MEFLIPEKNNKLLRAYHISSKAIIPLMLSSYIGNKYFSDYQKPLHVLNVLNFGYHSYVSTSCIITDYIKHPTFSKASRITNLNMHLIGGLGALLFIKNMEKITKINKE